MAHNWKAVAKHTVVTVGEVGAITGGIILTKKFLDFKVLFKNQIAADPNYANKFHIKHQGAIKLVGGAALACFIKNPWIRMFAIGIAIEGAITETRTLTTNAEGVSFFDSIGAGGEDDGDTGAIDQELIEAARETSGRGGQKSFGNRFPTTVGANDFGSRFPTTVGNMGWGEQPTSYTAGF